MIFEKYHVTVVSITLFNVLHKLDKLSHAHFLREKYVNENDVIDGWAIIISCQGNGLQKLKIQSYFNCGGGATIYHPPGSLWNGD